jgi:predicted nucleotidyltransferase
VNPNFSELLPLLANHGVEFILVGGGAAIAHGSARMTLDVDVVYSRSPENILRLADALTRHQPYLRGAPPGLPFKWDAATITAGLNFTLTTAMGDVDLLADIPGGRTYEDLLNDSMDLQVFGTTCKVVTLSKLIHLKKAAGRPKDLEAIAELIALSRRP